MIVREAIEAATDALDASGCASPKLDAQLLIADALGVTRERLFLDPDMEISPAAARVIAENVRRRNEREPVAYILGRKGFRNFCEDTAPRDGLTGRLFLESTKSGVSNQCPARPNFVVAQRAPPTCARRLTPRKQSKRCSAA